MNKLLFQLTVLFFTTLITLTASQKDADNIAQIVAIPLYTVDKSMIQETAKIFIKNYPNLKALKIIETVSQETYLTIYKDKNKTTYNKKLPQTIKDLNLFKSKSMYKNEEVGEIFVYFEDESNQNINIAFAFGRAPYLFDITSQKGIEIDIVKRALELQNYNNITIHQMRYKKQQNILLSKKSNIDVIASVQETKQNGIFYSDTFSQFNNGVITRKSDNYKIESSKDLLNKKVVAWYNAHKVLTQEYYELFKPQNAPSSYREAEDQEEQHALFFSKEVDAIVVDTSIFEYYKNKLKFDFDTKEEYVFHKIFEPFTGYKVAFKNKKMRDKFNEGIKELKASGEYDAITQSYSKVDMHKQLTITQLMASFSSQYINESNKKGLEKAFKPFFELPFIEGFKVIDLETEKLFFEKYRNTEPKNHPNMLLVEKDVFFSKKGQSTKIGKITVFFKKNATSIKLDYPKINQFDYLTTYEQNRIRKIYIDNLLLNIVSNPFAVSLTNTEKRWIYNNTVKVGVSEFKPLIFSNTGKDIDGIEGDVLKLIIEKTGLKIEVFYDQWDKVINDFKDKKIDLLPAAYYTKERSTYGLYSPSYYSIHDYIYVKEDNTQIKSMEDLNGKTLAIPKGFGTIPKIQNKFPAIKIVLTKDLDDSINRVLHGDVDALFEGQLVAEYKFQNELIKGLKAVSQNDFKTAPLYLLTRKDLPILHSILNKTLKSIPKSKINKIKSRWILEEQEYTYELDKEVERKEISFIGLLSIEEIFFSFLLLIILLLIVYNKYSKSKLLNIKFKIFSLLIIAFEFSVIFFLIYEIAILDRTENLLSTKHQDKSDGVKITDMLRQSSDDLTHFARAYVVTNNLKYKKQYFEILDIRNGVKARPLNYDFIYWYLSEINRKRMHPDMEKKSLQDLIKEFPLTGLQKSLIKLSEDNSNNLVKMEIKAFEAMKENNQSLAIKLLYSDIYYKEKEKIMTPLDNLLLTINLSLNKEIEYLNFKIKNQFLHILIIGLFFVLGNFIIYLMFLKKVNNPIGYLFDIIEQFRLNEKVIERKTFYDDEIGQTIKQFFIMKDAIDEQKDELEQTIFSLQSTQKKLVEAEKMASLGGVVAGVAHEINTPVGIGITAITHFSDITEKIKKDYDDDNISKEDFEQYITISQELSKSISVNLSRIAHLVNSFKQIAVDQTAEEEKNFNLKEYMNKILISINHIIKENKLTVNMQCDKNINIYSYSGAFSQIITNLIINSVKHAYDKNKKGIISINIERKNNILELLYKDDGKGISKENLPKIFDPFFTTNRVGGGTGLGLNIIYNLVTNNLHGTIKCDSKEGEGALFTITIPLS